jgi:hypothetical protein
MPVGTIWKVYSISIDNKKDKNYIIENTARILSYQYHKNYHNTYKITLFNCLSGGMPSEEPTSKSLSYKEAKEIWDNFDKIDIREKTKRFDNEFVKDFNSLITKSKSRIYKDEILDFFKDSLYELYECRNMIIHKSYINSRQEAKLKSTIPELIKLVRKLIVEEIRLNKAKSFAEIMNTLIKKANSKF